MIRRLHLIAALALSGLMSGIAAAAHAPHAERMAASAGSYREPLPRRRTSKGWTNAYAQRLAAKKRMKARHKARRQRSAR